MSFVPGCRVSGSIEVERRPVACNLFAGLQGLKEDWCKMCCDI